MRVVIDGGPAQVVAGVLRGGHGGPFYLARLDGWDAPPAPQAEATALPSAGGAAWPASLAPSARQVTVGLVAVACDSVEAERLLAVVGGLAGRRLVMSVEGPLGELSSACYLADAPQVTRRADGRGFSADLVLTCPDPMRYGRRAFAEASGGRASALVGGNAPTWPRLVAEGPCTSLSVSMGGREVRWEGEGPVVLDLYGLSATSGEVVKGEAFALEPGRNSVRVVASGATSVVMEWREAWR